MKIGILTLQLRINYGGILQAYALQSTLEKMGHSVSVIYNKEHKWKLPLWKIVPVYTKRICKRLLTGKGEIFFERNRNRESELITQNTKAFIEKYIHQRFLVQDMDITENEFDAIVVGSDQVWRPKYVWKKKVTSYFLDFAESWNILRVAYAASFGTDQWEFSRRETKECSRLIRKFKAVSVREQSGIRLCSDYLHYDNAVHVLDPTLLLTAAHYRNLISQSKENLRGVYSDSADEKNQRNKGLTAVYVLDPDPISRMVLSAVEQETGFETKVFGLKAEKMDSNLKSEDRIQPPVEQWLQSFAEADFVVTDSFHGCVFSIIFEKNFIVNGNKTRGLSRVKSLLETLRLENRLVTETASKELIIQLIHDSINYISVNEILEKERKKSLSFLQNALQEDPIL